MNEVKIQTDDDFAPRLAKLISENGSASLIRLWDTLDGRARANVTVFIEFYIGRRSDKLAAEMRRKRSAFIKTVLTKQIAALRKAHTARAAFEELDWQPFGNFAALGDPFWPQGYGPLSTILATELLRLNKLLGAINNLSNEKRMGIAAKHYWLVIAQEFVHNWTTRQWGKAIDLSPAHLADLIDLARWAMGKRRKRLTNPENLYRALRKFRKNPLNKAFCEAAAQRF